MCLDNITKTNLPQGTVTAYKVFKTRGKKRVLFGVHQEGFSYKRRKWLIDKNTKSINSTTRYGYSSFYQTGFHCFTSAPDALKYAESDEVIHRVLLKEITAIGEQGIYSCICARQMFIMEEITNENL